ncbi:hypothetical protein J6590_020802 [Homalodisca vitripennis]|nr:hypothetical protein J6590_020802 [Homalodisca vitripennis]
MQVLANIYVKATRWKSSGQFLPRRFQRVFRAKVFPTRPGRLEFFAPDIIMNPRLLRYAASLGQSP